MPRLDIAQKYGKCPSLPDKQRLRDHLHPVGVVQLLWSCARFQVNRDELLTLPDNIVRLAREALLRSPQELRLPLVPDIDHFSGRQSCDPARNHEPKDQPQNKANRRERQQDGADHYQTPRKCRTTAAAASSPAATSNTLLHFAGSAAVLATASW